MTSESSGPLRVVLADDHYLVREGVRQLLESSGRIDVVGAVADGDALLDVVRTERPAAVVTDIRMPPSHGLEGIEAAHRIRDTSPDVGVVVLSQHADEAYAFELFKHGTQGLAYLLKHRVGDLGELLRALDEVRAGRSAIDPLVVDALVGRRARDQRTGVSMLTPRELDVLRAMAEGRNNRGIASALVLSESAVEKHIGSIFTKLGLEDDADVHRRVSAVVAYLRGS